VSILYKHSNVYLTSALLIVSLLKSGEGCALSLGEIKIHSALNQLLNAEIPLMLNEGEQLTQISVVLASSKRHEEAGILWNAELAHMQFSLPINHAKPSIKVTSTKVIKEPVLNFLLSIDSGRRHVQREFTLLLDPQESYVPTPLQSQADSSVNTAQVPATKLKTSRQLSKRKYGPTGKGESLLQIAKRLAKGTDVSVEQVEIALYEHNPHAFYRKNLNALSVGQTLSIPSQAHILKIPYEQAKQAIAEHVSAFQNNAAEPPTDLATTLPALGNKLTLSAPEATSTLPGASLHTIENSAAEVARQQTKIIALEQHITSLHAALQSKDAELTALQYKLGASNLAAAQQNQTSQPVDKVVATPPSVAVKPIAVLHESVNVTDAHSQEGGGYLFAMSALGILAIAGLGWFGWRQRQQQLAVVKHVEKGAEHFFTQPEETQIVPESVSISLTEQDNFEENHQLNTDQGQLDPLAEVDVYLAYGNHQQAEKLMRTLIDEHHDNADYKLKLLEIFYTTNQSHAFAEYAEELAVMGQHTESLFWQKVEKMGGEVSAQHALFSHLAQGAATPHVAEPVNAPTAVIEDTRFDMTSLEDFFATSKAEDEVGLPLEPSLLTEYSETKDSSLAFHEALEFNDLAPKAQDDTLDVLTDELDDSFHVIDFKIDKKEETQSRHAPELTLTESFNEDAFFTSLNDSKEDDLELTLSSVAETVDFETLETKLDLAIAHIDKGDLVAAQKIAAEVFEKGTPEQQMVARAIIEGI
jgi:pilus assembly protein FimV